MNSENLPNIKNCAHLFAAGGVYTFDSSVAYSSVTTLPSDAIFIVDLSETSEGHGGTTTTLVKSDATVINFKANEDGSLIMPPVYLQAPVYVFRSADGNEYYKVQLTQYQDENSVTGHEMFNYAQIN